MKNAKLVLALVVVLVMCMTLSACQDPITYTLDKTTLSLEEGKTQQLKVIASDGSQATVTYSSSDAKVATVSNSGLVTAVAPGSATITAKVGETELKCAVTVTAKPVEYTYAISKSSVQLEVGESETLSVTVTPNKSISVTWTSSAPAVATVDNGVVTAVAPGSAKITASVDGKSLTCDVTVVKPAPLFTLTPSGTQDLEAGKTLQLEVTSSDEDPFEVVWSSSNDEVATVDQNGLVTAIAKGEAIIKATIGEVEKTCTIKVFQYEYAYAQEMTLSFGEAGKIEVSVAPSKEMALSFQVSEGTSISVDAQGNITTEGIGASTIIIKDGDKQVGQIAVQVNAVFTTAESVKLHAGATYQIEIASKPEGAAQSIAYASNNEAVATVSETGLISAVANGSATITITVDGITLQTEVVVSDTFASSSIELLPNGNRDNPIDLTAGAEYWEQYIANEVNHKAYVTAEEDIINMSADGLGYLPDYKSFISWNGGANGSTCACGKCNKESQNGGDGGWTNDGTKAAALNVVGAVIRIEIKLQAGQSTIKIYTGGYNLIGRVQLKLGEQVLGEESFNNQSAHNSQCVTFQVSTLQAQTVVAELVMENNFGDDGHSCISLAGVSVSGDVYQLEKAGVRLVPGEEAQIVLNKNGEALAEGITYELISGEGIVSLDGGKVTALAVGEAKVKATADGRERIFTVEVGYVYKVEESIALHVGEKYQLNVVSEPAGSTAKATFQSGDETIAKVSESGEIEAIANGVAYITVTVDGKVLTVTVNVADVVASAEVTKLGKDKANPIDLTAGAEYWEQYIAGEENHKLYTSVQEDIIVKSAEGLGYLSDYPAFISWNGGANQNICDCGHCNKEDQNGGDGGWNGDAGTKAAALNVVNGIISLEFKVYAGDRDIKIYTGGYNLKGLVELKLDGQVIASATFDNQSAHNSQLVTFHVSANKDVTLVAELSMTDNYGDNGNSCISLVAASISGDVYQLADAEVRIASTGEYAPVLNKNGEPLTEGVELAVIEGNDVVEIVDGKVKALKAGSAKVQVSADGRVRTLTVNVGYEYSVGETHLTLKQGATHQIVVTSDPAGSTEKATYATDSDAIAKVDENGLVTAVGAGEAHITITVEGKQYIIQVVVTGMEVSVANRNIAGEMIDLTADNVIYWEHYIWNETNPMAIENDAQDIINMDISDNGGDPGYGAHMYFTGSRGPKADSFNDGAYHKFSRDSLFQGTVTVPAGTHEIRIYTGAWENTQNKVSLLDGEQELTSYTIEKTAGGINVLVTFTVTTEEAKTLTVKLQALEGDNCRLAAIAVATPEAPQSIVASHEQTELDGNDINLSTVGTIDWVKYNVEKDGTTNNVIGKANGTLISRNDIGTGNGWDYKAKFTWGEDGSVPATDCDDGDFDPGIHNNFRFADEFIDATVHLTADVKTITLYVSGWNSNYGLYIINPDGQLEYVSDVFTSRDGGSHAFAITLKVNVAEEGDYKLCLRRLGSDGNMGFAAIALGE